MAMLTQLRESQDRPINEMLHESVWRLDEKLTGEKPLDSTPPRKEELIINYDI